MKRYTQHHNRSGSDLCAPRPTCGPRYIFYRVLGRHLAVLDGWFKQAVHLFSQTARWEENMQCTDTVELKRRTESKVEHINVLLPPPPPLLLLLLPPLQSLPLLLLRRRLLQLQLQLQLRLLLLQSWPVAMKTSEGRRWRNKWEEMDIVGNQRWGAHVSHRIKIESRGTSLTSPPHPSPAIAAGACSCQFEKASD
jgi:hypothetical protein